MNLLLFCISDGPDTNAFGTDAPKAIFFVALYSFIFIKLQRSSLCKNGKKNLS